MDPATMVILGGAGLGAFGGAVRTLIGMRKEYQPGQPLKIDKIGAAFNVVFGIIGGGLAAGSGLLNDPLGLIAAGYAGADFVEGLVNRKYKEVKPQ